MRYNSKCIRFHECMETKSQVPLRSARTQLALVTDLVSAEQICSFSRSRKAPSAPPAGHLEGTIIAHDINYDVSGWTPTAARQPTPWTQADAANAWMQMCVRSGTTWFLNTRLIWKKWAVSVFIVVCFIPLLLLWEVALKIQCWASGMRLRNSPEWPSNCVHPHFFFHFPRKCLNSHKRHSHLFSPFPSSPEVQTEISFFNEQPTELWPGFRGCCSTPPLQSGFHISVVIWWGAKDSSGPVCSQGRTDANLGETADNCG